MRDEEFVPADKLFKRRTRILYCVSNEQMKTTISKLDCFHE